MGNYTLREVYGPGQAESLFNSKQLLTLDLCSDQFLPPHSARDSSPFQPASNVKLSRLPLFIIPANPCCRKVPAPNLFCSLKCYSLLLSSPTPSTQPSSSLSHKSLSQNGVHLHLHCQRQKEKCHHHHEMSWTSPKLSPRTKQEGLQVNPLTVWWISCSFPILCGFRVRALHRAQAVFVSISKNLEKKLNMENSAK